MKIDTFSAEIKRLKTRFGNEQFDPEFQKLIWIEVRDLPDDCMKQIVNHCIGEFRPDWPPRISDIRTFAEQLRKSLRQQESEKALQVVSSALEQKAKSDAGLQKLLKEKNANSILDLIFKKGTQP